MRIIFTIEDDVAISSEEVEVEIDNEAFEIPSDFSKLKPLCKAIARLRGHWARAEIANVSVESCRGKGITKVQAYGYLKEFTEYLMQYARECKENGYDGIGENDIEEKMIEFYR